MLMIFLFSNVSSITKNKSFGQAFCGESPPPVLSILFYPIGWVDKKRQNEAKSEK